MSELYILGQDDKLLTTLTEENGLITAPFREERNRGSSFSFVVEADVEEAKHVLEENKVVFRDKDGDLRLFVIKELDDIDNMEGPQTEAICEPEFMENKERIIIDRRLENRTQQYALNAALERTRWEGEVEVDLGLATTNFYYISAVEAVWKILEVWGGEFKDVVEFDEENNIIRRVIKIVQRLGADRGKRAEIDYDIEEIQRTVLSYPVTALVGRGASLETDNGGFTRYINFADVEWKKSNGDPVDKPLGQHWVGDPQALQKNGRKHNGQLHHREEVWQDGNIEDPVELLQATWEKLQEVKESEVNYRMRLQLLEKIAGYEHEKVMMGDTIRGIDRKFARPIEIQSRVIAFEYDVLDIEGTSNVELGQFLSVHEDDRRLDDVAAELDSNRRRWTDASRPISNDRFPDIIPPVPANIRVEDGYNDIQLYWDYPDVIYIKHYEVYGSQVQGFIPDSQHLLGRTSTAAFHHRATVDQKWYFRIRAVNHHGRASDFSPEVSGSTLRIITDDILFGENVAEMLRRDMLIAEMIADDSITWDMVSEAAKNRLELESRQYAQEEITLVENSLMNQIADKAGFDYVDGQLQLKADQATVDDQISTVMQELADKASLTYVDGQLVDKVNVGTVYTISEIDNKFDNVVSVTEYQTDQQGIVQWMNATETRIEQTETDISSRVTRTEFDNLQVGGRNLIRNSDFSRGLENWTVLGDPELTGEGAFLDSGVIIDGYNQSTYIQPQTYLPAGEYTVQIWYKHLEGDLPYLWESGSEGEVNERYPFQAGEGWQIAVIRFTTEVESRFYRIRYANASPEGHTDGRTLIGAIQIERGNKPQDWNPAFEDTLGEIEGAKQRLTIAETAINQNATDINLRATKTELNSVDSSLSEAWAEINIQAGLIQQKVDSTTYQTDHNGIVTRFENVESVQEQHAGLISQRVTETTYNAGINQLNTLIESKAQEYKINFSFSSSTDYVILLCRADASGTSNFVVGTLTGRRVSGHVSSGKVEIVFNNSSSGTLPVGYIEATEIQSINRFEMVTCTFQGNSYIALRHRPNNEFRLWDTDARFYGQIGSSGEMLRPVQTSGVSNIQVFQSSQPVSSPITKVETAIDQNATAINLRATKTEVNAIEGRLSQAESTLSVQAGQIEAKVDVDGIVSELNINREGIRIRGALIELDGDTLIRNGIIGTAAIANGAIERAKLGTAVVGTLQVEDGAITNAKIASLNADKINTPSLSAISANMGTVRSGRLLSNNNNMDLNLNTGTLYMQNADFTLGGGASIVFADAGNKITYSILGPNNFFRTAGFGVGRVAGNDLPFSYVGSTPGGNLDTLDSSFSGLMTHTTYHINNNDASNSISGNRFALRNTAVGWDRGINFNWNDTSIRTISPGNFDYEIGTFRRIYGKQSLSFTNYFNERSGWLMETQYSGSGADIVFRGSFGADYNYQIGQNSTNNAIRNIYLRNQPVIVSDERAKEDITDNTTGLSFINSIKTKMFRLKQKPSEGVRNPLQFGFIAQEIVMALNFQEIDIDDHTIIGVGEDGLYNLKEMQLIAPTIKAVQEVDKKVIKLEDEVNWLKIENQLLRNEIKELKNKIA
ncbi:phage tail protein [Evansella clarkii]|uniref:phage tail protein n=1 Tax=Evansella clarkii TaxID=79879 RepID=UPI001ADC2142|nr:phage tail protein [Evansella clarkii]